MLIAPRIHANAKTALRHAVQFWSHVRAVPDPDACWEWTGALRSKSILYGSCRWGQAHKAALYLATGQDCEGLLYVLHSCDNKLCCNPKHLSIGTHRENVLQARDRGRSLKANGTHHSAKLTRPQVAEVRARYAAGGTTQAALGKEFGISQIGISLIVREKTYRAR